MGGGYNSLISRVSPLTRLENCRPEFCFVVSEFQPNTFTTVIASVSEAIYNIKKITSSGVNISICVFSFELVPPRNDVPYPLLLSNQRFETSLSSSVVLSAFTFVKLSRTHIRKVHSQIFAKNKFCKKFVSFTPEVA